MIIERYYVVGKNGQKILVKEKKIEKGKGRIVIDIHGVLGKDGYIHFDNGKKLKAKKEWLVVLGKITITPKREARKSIKIPERKIVRIPKKFRDRKILGRIIRDVGLPGLSDMEEVKAFLNEVSEDAKAYRAMLQRKGYSRIKMANLVRLLVHRKTMVLLMALKKVSPERFSRKEKREAIELINKFRKKYGLKIVKV